MKTIFSKYREYFLVGLVGFVIFACLNVLMLQMNYDVWTSTRYGAYTAFHKGWELSGFDNTTYIAVAEWRPLYVMMRHPLIMYFVWPMYQLCHYLKDELDINCSIFIVAGVWTLISTVAWLLLYRIMRKLIELPVMVSLLLCLFYFSFSHVMLATFVPDHMILSMTLFLVAIYISAKSARRGSQMVTWKALLLTFVSTGISTTNFAKIWLIDICSMQGKVALCQRIWWKKFILHGMLYLLPLAAVGGLYYYETETIFAEEEGFAANMEKKAKERNPEKVLKESMRSEQKQAREEAKQLVDNKLFQWTDFSLPLAPSIVENFLGESIQLHEDYLLKDSNLEGHRPSIVYYTHWYNYLVEAIIALLLIAGAWCGRKERLMWMALAVFGFDCALHLGFRFALNDVYIMAAHWAFVIPIAVGYLYKYYRSSAMKCNVIIGVVALLTVWLWYHNLSLIYDFIINVQR